MKPEMTLEEILNYCKKNGIDTKSVGLFFNGGIIIIRDPRCNDLSKPGFALLYNCRKNIVALVKVDSIKKKLICDNTARMFENENVKDAKTFLDFINNKINPYCREHNCDYRTAISDTEKSICVTSRTDPNQKIIYDKTNKRIVLFESSKPTILQLNKALSIFIEKENNFVEFAKESFEFCKKNECSLEYYAKEISPEMLGFKCILSKYAEKHQQEKLLYTFFDKDSKTGFAYYNNNTINALKTIGNGFIYFKIRNRPSFLLKSNERFEAYIKTKKASIDEEVDKRVKDYIEKRNALKRFTSANNEFEGRSHER